MKTEVVNYQEPTPGLEYLLDCSLLGIFSLGVAVLLSLFLDLDSKPKRLRLKEPVVIDAEYHLIEKEVK